jgi:hypothetical protein
MHTSEVWEEMGVVAPKVRNEFCIFIESQKLANDLYGENFRVAERWSGSTCSETTEFSDAVVDETENGHDEGAKIHKKKTSAMSGAIWVNTERREVFCLTQVLKETCTRG